MANIFTAINACMNDIGVVGKNDRNEQQRFMYRGIDAVMNAINPALIKNKVFVVPEVLEQTREERQTKSGGNLIYSICKVKYTFYAEDGSNISATVIGEGMDSGDKATNKAMSIAFKYACFQVFCIPTEEMVDPDAECHEVKEVAKVTAMMVKTIKNELERTGVSGKSLAQAYKVDSIEDLNVKDYQDAMTKLKAKPDKEKNEK